MTKYKHIALPLEVWESKAIDLAEKFLYAEIASYAAKGRECFMSNTAIAELLGCKIRWAIQHLNNLKKAGFITVETFDGRCRKLQCRGAQKCTADVHDNAQQTCMKMQHTISISTSSDKSSEDRYTSTMKEKNTKKEKTFSFRNALVEIGVAPATADAWLQVRKTKKATNTQIAFEAVRNEIQKTGKSAEDCIRCAVVNSWAGFRASWLVKEQAGTTTTGRRENYVEAGLRVADELLGTNYMAQLNKLKNGQ
jgi:DNA-binding Lrp family transcriptional regulator